MKKIAAFILCFYVSLVYSQTAADLSKNISDSKGPTRAELTSAFREAVGFGDCKYMVTARDLRTRERTQKCLSGVTAEKEELEQRCREDVYTQDYCQNQRKIFEEKISACKESESVRNYYVSGYWSDDRRHFFVNLNDMDDDDRDLELFPLNTLVADGLGNKNIADGYLTGCTPKNDFLGLRLKRYLNEAVQNNKESLFNSGGKLRLSNSYKAKMQRTENGWEIVQIFRLPRGY